MSFSPFFSIIIPTYNRPSQLSKCLLALTQQDYPANLFEVIVVDDGSHSLLDDVIGKFSNRLDLEFIRQENSGPATARNRGAKVARGEYLIFSDDDCRPATNWLSAFAKRFSKTPNHLIGGKIDNRLANNIYASVSQLILDMLYEFYNCDHSRATFLTSCNIGVSSKLFSELGGFDPSFRFSEDRELCNRWLFNGYQIVFAPEVISCHDDNVTNFIGFSKRYFNYGKGAHHYHKTVEIRGSGNLSTELGFYSNFKNWLLYPYTHFGVKRAFALSILLLFWQAINAAGFFWASAKKSFF